MGRFISNALFEIKTNSDVRLFRTKRGDKTFAISSWSYFAEQAIDTGPADAISLRRMVFGSRRFR
jgi:hypothetical protein